MSLASGIHSLWLASLLLKGLLVAVLIGRRMWDKFPWFTAYCISSFLETSILYLFTKDQAVYLYVYLVGEALSIVLGLAVAYEVFSGFLATHLALRKLATLAFRATVVLLVILAVIVVYVRLPLNFTDARATLMTVEEAARVLEVGLILFLFIFSSAFGLHWRQPVFGVALGLGILAAVKLAVVTVVQHLTSAAGVLNLALLLSIDLSLVIWVGYLLVPERIASSAGVPDRKQLEQWNQAIMELIHQ
jgi:hypothetical protein